MHGRVTNCLVNYFILSKILIIRDLGVTIATPTSLTNFRQITKSINLYVANSTKNEM